MLEFLPNEIRDGLESARLRKLKRKSRLRIRVNGEVYPVLRLWEGGFALTAEGAPRLRGLVDLYDGANHILECLIIASVEEEGQIICEFKRYTPVSDRPPLDYWQEEGRPVGYLPSH